MPDFEPQAVLQTDDFVILAKPAGMETISRDGGPELTALARAATGDANLVPVHRLDRDTSGAQLMARNAGAENELVRLFRKRDIEKTYLAVCLGVPRNRSGTINRNLSEWGGGRRPVKVVKKGGLEASTAYEVRQASKIYPDGLRLSLVAFHPRQGRTHQIRVHAASLGYPVLGDDQYGDRAANQWAKKTFGLKRQALHSWRLAFAWKGERIDAAVPLPDDMRAVLGGF